MTHHARLTLLLLALTAAMAAQADNLFATLLGKTPAETDARLDSVWTHFFTPADLSRYEADGERSVYYETPAGDMAFVMDTGSNDVRTEGMSYGMMIAVQLDRREHFDKLWNWSKRHMAYGADTPWDGYFCWQVRPDGTKFGGSNASDGELYYATALFLAAERWKQPSYAAEADAILGKIMSKNGRGGVYSLFNRDNALITFVPDSIGRHFTDPSYMLPAFLDKWARCAATDRDFWSRAADAARAHLNASAHPQTGLWPDYSNYDGSAYRWPMAGYDTSVYMYDAIRCAMNAGMDYYLCGKDRDAQRDVLRRLLSFFKADGYRHAHFRLDGTPLGDDGYTRGMAGANAAAAHALADSPDPADRELAREYVQALWDAEPPTGKYRYYEGMVYFLGMLHTAGRFSLDF